MGQHLYFSFKSSTQHSMHLDGLLQPYAEACRSMQHLAFPSKRLPRFVFETFESLNIRIEE